MSSANVIKFFLSLFKKNIVSICVSCSIFYLHLNMEERSNHKRSLETHVKTHFNKCELTDLKLQTFDCITEDGY